jgi:tRNA(fMet)-specific endonuclease VapC
LSGYLLDTNIIGDVIRNPGGPAAGSIGWIDPKDICTRIKVAAELR